MRSEFKGSSHGFSLVEMLVVIAIIGVLSLISVPVFMNFRNANTFRSNLRNFTQDLRAARQYAITHAVRVRVELDSGTQTSRNYAFFSSNDNGTTWTNLQMPGSHGLLPGTTGNIKNLEGPVWFNSSTALPDVAPINSKPDIIYHPNGAMETTAGAARGEVVMRCEWKQVTHDRYTIELSASGQLKSTGDHT